MQIKQIPFYFPNSSFCYYWFTSSHNTPEVFQFYFREFLFPRTSIVCFHSERIYFLIFSSKCCLEYSSIPTFEKHLFSAHQHFLLSIASSDSILPLNLIASYSTVWKTVVFASESFLFLQYPFLLWTTFSFLLCSTNFFRQHGSKKNYHYLHTYRFSIFISISIQPYY